MYPDTCVDDVETMIELVTMKIDSNNSKDNLKDSKKVSLDRRNHGKIEVSVLDTDLETVITRKRLRVSNYAFVGVFSISTATHTQIFIEIGQVKTIFTPNLL